MDSIAHILQFFRFSHLQEGKPKAMSEKCAELAHHAAGVLPRNPETTAGLRKLLEAKDCFVRSALIEIEDEEKG